MRDPSSSERTPLVDEASSSPGSASSAWPPQIALALLSLTLTNVACQATRFLLNFLYMEPAGNASSAATDPFVSIAQELHMTPSQFGLLSGPLLLIGAVVASVFVGVLADDVRVGPRVAVVGGMLLQGGSMCGQGLVASMESLFAVRVFLAAGQGAVTAPALALISHMVKDPGHRATANSVFGTGVYLGTGLAAGGGLMAVHFGWRVTSAAFGILCLVSAAAVVLCVPLPVGKGHGDEDDGSRDEAETDLLVEVQHKFVGIYRGLRFWGSSSTCVALVGAGSLRYIAGFAGASFLPVYLEGAYGHKTAMLASYGTITALAGLTSSLLGGYATQLLTPRSPVRVCVCLCLCLCLSVCLSACLSVCLCLCSCESVCMHVCMHVCMLVCNVCMDVCNVRIVYACTCVRT